MSGSTDNADQEYLNRQLIRLGDMLGDGDAEPWVGKEYRRICRLLGYTSNRRRTDAARTETINTRMVEQCKEEQCPGCKRHSLKQSRSGSMSANCTICGLSFKLLRRAKK
ncbi:hypothetical protein FR773_26225 (plasmid) [Leclercia adecarboxylata]|uniref:hypothetical protein n=1 Tax=Leclercia adecarboxylata TaxID=83655 RepID=UPI0012A7B2CD|nr:hypothetical protein [Leclercia adecarboxylata]QFH68127.1 hypothetical protein FR773_26225 [Leclercia adecarboxylata]